MIRFPFAPGLQLSLATICIKAVAKAVVWKQLYMKKTVILRLLRLCHLLADRFPVDHD